MPPPPKITAYGVGEDFARAVHDHVSGMMPRMLPDARCMVSCSDVGYRAEYVVGKKCVTAMRASLKKLGAFYAVYDVTSSEYDVGYGNGSVTSTRLRSKWTFIVEVDGVWIARKRMTPAMKQAVEAHKVMGVLHG